MSATQTFAFCIDCWELHYGIPDSNGVFDRDSPSSNHWDHAVHVFGTPDEYAPPIRGVLTSLHAGLPVSDGRMELFSLALAVTAIQPNNGRKAAGADIPLGAPVKKKQAVETEPDAPALFEFGGAA